MKIPQCRPNWTTAQVASSKASIRSELAAVNGDSSAKLRHSLRRLDEFSHSETPQEQLLRFIWAMNVLVLHMRSGGLKKTQVRSVFKLGQALLKANRVPPRKSKVSFLHGELHLILSQIYQKGGSLLQSAWEQQLFRFVSGESAPDGFAQVSSAIRALRLGDATLCESHCRSAMESGVGGETADRAKLELLKALRLSGRAQESNELFVDTLEREESPPSAGRLEVEWERLCVEMCQGQPPVNLIAAVKKGRPHHEVNYVVETFLWTRVVKDRRWLSMYPTVQQLARDSKIKLSRKDKFHRCALSIENCSDRRFDIDIRLQQATELIKLAPSLYSIDEELLVWAALVRCLVRERLYSLARIPFHEYAALGLRLSHGRNWDALGQLADLEATPLILGLTDASRERRRAA